MNKKMWKRVREAYHYERLAVKSLLGPDVSAHLEVIENEMKEMLGECIFKMIKAGMEDNGDETSPDEKKSKKVTIE